MESCAVVTLTELPCKIYTINYYHLLSLVLSNNYDSLCKSISQF